jgi:hypothetical protein
MSTARHFGDIRALAIAALEADPPIPGVKAIEPYAGQIADAIEGRIARFNLLTVAYVGEPRPELIDGPNYHEVPEFEVGVFVHSMRGAVDLNEQSEALILEVRQRLTNARLAANLEPVEPGATRLEISDATVQVYSFGFSVAMDQEYQWPT